MNLIYCKFRLSGKRALYFLVLNTEGSPNARKTEYDYDNRCLCENITELYKNKRSKSF